MNRAPLAASLLILALAAGLAGCSAGSPGTDTASAPAASAPATPNVEPAAGETISGTGYSYTVPEGWAVPEGTAGFGSDSVAVAQVPVGDFATNVNVVLSPAGALTPEEVESVVSDELAAGGATGIKILDRVAVAGSESAHVAAGLTSSGAAYRIHQYYVTNDDQTYVVTFSADDLMPDSDIEAIADSVLATWTWAD